MTINTPTRVIRTAFDIGDTVYHRMEPEKAAGVVTQILIHPGGPIYSVSWGKVSDGKYYELELTNEFIPEFICE